MSGHKLGYELATLKQTQVLGDPGDGVADATAIITAPNADAALCIITDADAANSRVLPDPSTLTVGTQMIVINDGAGTGMLIQEPRSTTIVTLEPNEAALMMVGTNAGTKEWLGVVLKATSVS